MGVTELVFLVPGHTIIALKHIYIVKLVNNKHYKTLLTNCSRKVPCMTKLNKKKQCKKWSTLYGKTVLLKDRTESISKL